MEEAAVVFILFCVMSALSYLWIWFLLPGRIGKVMKCSTPFIFISTKYIIVLYMLTQCLTLFIALIIGVAHIM